MLGLMGCVGNLAVGLVQPWMGGVNDRITIAAIPAAVQNQVVVERRDRRRESQGPARGSSKRSSPKPRRKGRNGRSVTSRHFPVILIFLFGGIALYDRVSRRL